jgi:hypothetical protein
MVNVGLSWLPLVLLLIQLTLLLWFIDTLRTIKLYLGEIRDMMRQSNRNLP